MNTGKLEYQSDGVSDRLTFTQAKSQTDRQTNKCFILLSHRNFLSWRSLFILPVRLRKFRIHCLKHYEIPLFFSTSMTDFLFPKDSYICVSRRSTFHLLISSPSSPPPSKRKILPSILPKTLSVMTTCQF